MIKTSSIYTTTTYVDWWRKPKPKPEKEDNDVWYLFDKNGNPVEYHEGHEDGESDSSDSLN